MTMKCLSGRKVALIYHGLVALTFMVRHNGPLAIANNTFVTVITDDIVHSLVVGGVNESQYGVVFASVNVRYQITTSNCYRLNEEIFSTPVA